MTNLVESSGAANLMPSNPRVAAMLVLLCGMLLVAASGCSGCFGKSAAEKEKEEEKEEEKPKPDFQVGRLRVQPSDDASVSKNAVKIGHWTVTSQRILANNFDFAAELRAVSVERGGRPVRVASTPYEMVVSTPAPLAKGQPRDFEMTYFVPGVPSQQNQPPISAWLRSSLRARRGGRELADTMQPTSTMPDYQYYLVVLAEDPSLYTALKRLDTVAPPGDELADSNEVVFYRVLLPRVERGAPLPSHALAWTSISTIVWDGMDPSLLTPYQQDAMLDWLHFGGQLIVSGPNSLDKLRGSFLDPYLPADKTKSADLDLAAFDEMNEYWSIAYERRNIGERETIKFERPLVGVELKLREEGKPIIKTGGLVAERMLGRGRVVVTGFPLAAREMKSWGCYDSFFHNVLLRRPRRSFLLRNNNNNALFAHYTDYPAAEKDPRLTTTLRMFSRDIQSGVTSASQRTYERRAANDQETWRFGGYSWWPDIGMGAWNNRSGVAMVARESLRRAAEITIPSGAFVFKVLVIYLVFLVPVNWAVFRLIGRVEWAWIAALVIAVIGSVAVVRLAQLDIGFARARTEVAVLELHGGYKRGHLSRFTALYTSLSTTYDFNFEDASAVAMPFPANLEYTPRSHDTIYTVEYNRDEQVSLSGFTVRSNSTGMVRSEHMYNLDGAIGIFGNERAGLQIKNDSSVKLLEAGVMRQTEEGLEISYLGELPAKSVKPLQFVSTSMPAGQQEAVIPQWAESKMLGMRNIQEGEISLAEMTQLASRTLRMRPGEMRLIAWTEDDLAGVEVRPAARQSKLRTLVLIHLVQGPLSDPMPDTNMRYDFIERRVLRDEDGDGDEEAPPDAEVGAFPSPQSTKRPSNPSNSPLPPGISRPRVTPSSTNP